MQTLKQGARLGDFSIIRLIARGGMGEVYEAHDMRLDRRIALKVISQELANNDENPDLIRRFMQEARLLAKVNHPNVVTVHAIDSASGVQFIAMEYVEGVSLKEFLREGAFTLEVAMYIFEQMLSGLKCLHDNKIIHRDLKPGNILVRADGQIKILDFGIARRLDRSSQTDPGFIIGTPNYMAPELREGALATPQSDFWSMGALFFECLTGRPYAQAVKNRHGSPFNSEHSWIPVELRTMITCMTATSAKERYSSAEQIIADLRTLRRTVMPPSESQLTTTGKQIQQIIEKTRPRVSPQDVGVNAAETAVVAGRMVDAAKRSEAAKQPEVVKRQEPVRAHEPAKPVESVKAGEGKSSAPPPLPKRSPQTQQFQFKPIHIAMVLAAIAVLSFILNDLTKEQGSIPQSSTKQAPPPAPALPVNPPPSSAGGAQSGSSALSLLEPADGQWIWEEPGKNPTFVWSRGLSAGEHRIQIAVDESFSKLVLSEDIANNWHQPSVPLPEGKYYWRLLRQGMPQSTDPKPRSFGLTRFEPVRLVHPEPGATLQADRSGGLAELEWTCKPLVERYRVQVGNDQDFQRPVRDEILQGCKMNLSALGTGKYFWRVGLVDAPDRRDVWSAAWPISVAPPQRRVAPERPLELGSPVIRSLEQTRTLVDSSKSGSRKGNVWEASVDLDWYPVRGARDYEVHVSRSTNFSEILWEGTTTSDHIVFRANSPGVIYWRVFARSKSGVNGKASKTAIIRVLKPAPPVPIVRTPNKPSTRIPAAKPPLVPPPPPARPVVSKNLLASPAPLAPESAASAPSRNGRISIEFSWSAVPQAETYTIELALDAQFDEIVKAVTVPVTKVLLEKLELKGRVYWRVRANGAAQKSAWSKPAYLDVEPM